MLQLRVFIGALLALSPAYATVVITSPTGDTTWAQDTHQTIVWAADASDPAFVINIWPSAGGGGLTLSHNTSASSLSFNFGVGTNIVVGKWYISMAALSDVNKPIARSPSFTIAPAVSSSSATSQPTSSTPTAPSQTATVSIASSTQSSLSSSQSSSVSSTTSPSASTSPDPRPTTSHTGAIAGGVVGGVVGLALVGLLVFFLLRRRRRDAGSNTDPSNISGSETLGSGVTFTARPQGGTLDLSPKPYNYDDPSTWPPSMADIQSGAVSRNEGSSLRSSTAPPRDNGGRAIPEPM